MCPYACLCRNKSSFQITRSRDWDGINLSNDTISIVTGGILKTVGKYTYHSWDGRP